MHRIAKVSLLAVAVALAAAVLAPTADAARGCPKGKTAWKLDGRKACLKTKLGRGEATVADASSRWILDSARMRGRKLPRSLRPAVPVAARAAARLAGIAVRRGRGARAAGARVTETMQLPETSVKVKDVTVSSRAELRRLDDGRLEVDMEIEARAPDGKRAVWRPVIGNPGGKPDAVGCPTADGRVSVLDVEHLGGTSTVLDGRRVVSASTLRERIELRSEGRGGADARLREVKVEVVSRIKAYERGRQLDATIRATLGMGRDGSPAVRSGPAVDVALRVASRTRGQERREERQAAREIAGGEALADALGKQAGNGRKRLLDAEAGWYEIPNGCVKARWTPDTGGTLEQGQSREVTMAAIATRDGGEATGSVAARAMSGEFSATAPSFAPGVPARFAAKGGKPNELNTTALGSVIITSTAGRADSGWLGSAGAPANLPKAFDGWVEVVHATNSSGHTRRFSGYAAFELRWSNRGPDGSVNAWYDLIDHEVYDSHATLYKSEGCRYQADDYYRQGVVENGDLEIRILPGGQVVYGFLYDVKLPSVYLATDCPPDVLMPPLAQDLAIHLDSRRPPPAGESLRPGPSDFNFAAKGLTDVRSTLMDHTEASWSLEPRW